jgi:hypothetical protein
MERLPGWLPVSSEAIVAMLDSQRRPGWRPLLQYAWPEQPDKARNGRIYSKRREIETIPVK